MKKSGKDTAQHSVLELELVLIADSRVCLKNLLQMMTGAGFGKLRFLKSGKFSSGKFGNLSGKFGNFGKLRKIKISRKKCTLKLPKLEFSGKLSFGPENYGNLKPEVFNFPEN